jgi:hypothetical protein
LCNLLYAQACNILFLRSVAHALAGVDPLNPLAEGVTLAFSKLTYGQVERLTEQCVAMAGVGQTQLEAFIDGLSGGCPDTPAVTALKTHLGASMAEGFMAVAPALNAKAAKALMCFEGDNVPDWPLENWAVCNVCGLHVEVNRVHAHQSSRDAYGATECARLASGLGKGKHPVNLMSGEVAELRLSRLNAIKAEMAAAAAAAASSVHDSHVQVETGNDLALHVQGLQQQILAMSQQMQQMQAALCSAAEIIPCHRAYI